MSTHTEELEAALAEANKRIVLLELAADTDELTGLMNRRGLERRTRDNHRGWYVSADLDGFKAAQDQHGRGHAYGDSVLQDFAAFLMMNTRQSASAFTPPRKPDQLATRTGGDEFVVWCDTQEGARRIMAAIQLWTSADGEVTASAGIGGTIEMADLGCYAFKQVRRSVS